MKTKIIIFLLIISATLNFVLIFNPFSFTNVIVTATPREKVDCDKLQENELCLKSDFDITIETKFFWQKDYEKF